MYKLTKNIVKLLLTFIILLTQLPTTILYSQIYQENNPNDERFKILALKKAKVVYEKNEKDYNDALLLYNKKNISKKELESYKLLYENSKLNYQQYMLSVIFDKPHLSIISAEKSKDNEGNITVELKLKNTSGGNYEIENLENDKNNNNSSSLIPSGVKNIYVSLKDESGSIISQPYEYHIKEMKNDELIKIKFSLLKDVDAITVSSNYGDKYDNKKIYLKRKSSLKSVSIIPELYAQEIESGNTAFYPITMEYYGEINQRYRLKLEDLPKYFSYEFTNATTNSIISNIMFSNSNNKQRFILKVTTPEKIGDNVELDKPVSFKVVLENFDGKTVGKTDLELTPTGKASLEFTMRNMFFTSEIGKNINIYPLKVKNDGLKSLTNISFNLMLPPEWEYKLTPKKIDKLNPGDEKKISLEIIPTTSTNESVMPGLYQIKLSSKAKSINRTIKTSEREIKIELNNKSNPLLVGVMILLGLVLVVGVIFVFARISKN